MLKHTNSQAKLAHNDGSASDGGAPSMDAAAGAKLDVAALRQALAKAAGVTKVSRADLGKLIGAHPNSIALWESGNLVGAKFQDKLRALHARVTKGEKVALPAKKKGGRPKKGAEAVVAKRKPGRPRKDATLARKPGRPPKSASEKSASRIDVKALRTRLGASRNALAKLLGVSVGSILNWESGKTTITARNVAKLAEVASKAERGAITLPEKRRPGRPSRKSSLAGTTTRGRPSTVAIAGQAPLVYANVLQIVRGTRESVIRFALTVPGEHAARAIADVVVPADVMDRLSRS